MRWILISLLIVNVGVFIYTQFIPAVGENAQQALATKELDLNTASASITLLIEAERSSANVQPIAAVPSTSTIKPEHSSLCTLVGPFSRLLSAEYFLEKLQSLGVNSEIRSIVVVSHRGYWLHLVPEKSRKEALRRLSELQARGIDSYVIPDGILANGVSLGMFSNKSRAQIMKAAIESKGYKPKIVDVPREQKELWVFLQKGEAAKIGDEKWVMLISAEDLLQKRQNVCTDLASR
ncbi:MAG: hypothetical protein ACI80S_000981 [Pseudohongiellaceae bacterium]|jgi:hypothetical protein